MLFIVIVMLVLLHDFCDGSMKLFHLPGMNIVERERTQLPSIPNLNITFCLLLFEPGL